MKIKTTILIALLVCASMAKAQEDSNRWKQQVLTETPSKAMAINSMGKYDFGALWLDNRTNYIGYIGDNYQKMDIHIEEVKKQSNTQYIVKGKSQVKTNICRFSGTVNIVEIRELKEIDTGVDDEMKGKVSKEGFIIVECTLKEDSAQTGSGMFKGILISHWYINLKGQLQYDDIQSNSDDYANNQFVGTWTSYKTKASKKCAWGHYRIPCSGDLDIGTAEFSVNPKYRNNGWNNKK